MSDVTETVGLELDLSDILANLDRVVGALDSSVQDMTKGLNTSMRTAEQAYRSTNKAQREALVSTRQLREGFGGLGDVAQALGLGPLDSLAGKSERLLRGFEDLGLAGGAGIAVAGVAGVGLAAAGSVAAILKAVDAAEKYHKELAAFEGLEGFGVRPEALASIKAANAAVGSLGTIMKQVVVTLGAEFAPGVEEAGTNLVAFGLMGLDAFEAFAGGHDILRELAVFLTDRLVKAILSPVSALADVVGWMGTLAKVAGASELGGALAGVEDAYDSFTRTISETAVDFYLDAAAESLTGLSDSTGTYRERATALIGVQATLGDKTKSTSSAVREQSNAMREAAEQAKVIAAAQAELADLTREAYLSTLGPLDQMIARHQVELEQVRALGQASGDRAAASDAFAAVELRQAAELAELRSSTASAYAEQRQQEHAAELARLEEQRQAAIGAASGFFGGLAAISQQAAEAQAKGNADAASRWYEWYQTAAEFQVGVDAAAAVMKALATLGPIAGGISAIGIGLTAASQIAAIESQQLPSFHTGGTMLAPDEHLAVMRRNESALTAQGTANAGGPEGVRSLNEGRQGGPQRIVVEERYRHRTFRRFEVVHRQLYPERGDVRPGRRF
jgi:hypothetical protein